MDGIYRYLGILRYNLKISVSWNYILTFLMSILFVFIFNIKFITYNELEPISELYFGLIGVILFTAIGNTERSEKMEQFIITKIPLIRVILLRIMMATVYTFLCVFLILLYAKVNGGSFDIIRCTLGIGISIIMIGFLGMAITNSFHDSRAGYIAAMSYYIVENRTKGEFTDMFFLYGILEDRDGAIYGSMIIIIILLIYNLVIIERKTVS